ncbi:glycosyltransferase family 2 protein [Arcobacter porcinus]|uniref:glycosyltransferase family 2 protein n=1 Tax=Arcobacter porcinus TaxID=1935204 RepID=UPI00081F2438|nr:glycosyltransferase family 2 protein [Arcobacter porcinus]OCL82122.1 Beta-monoglucosyldiacylglycerol synthase [Arcobacter porcinus]OCL84957.1 Beta-monoglucosyldiacylglycerol synthase [Arcobacter porcinus]
MRYLIFALSLSGLFLLFYWLTNDNFINLKEDSFDKVQSVSYSPFEGFERNLLKDEDIRKDIILLNDYTYKIRTYGTKEAEKILEAISGLENSNLKIDLGLWLGKDKEDNNIEIIRASSLLENYPSLIDSVIVGNEVLLRKDLDPIELFTYVTLVKDFTKKPVTIAETWDIWEKNPELSSYVDYVMIHILPYWEKVPIKQYNSFVVEKFTLIKDLFPYKKIVIGETGWPSLGYNNNSAVPSVKNQARAIRGFLNLAKDKGYTYNIIEAFDQPWKGYDEGNVGQYWGLFNTNREAKFTLHGEFQANKYWAYQIFSAIFLGVFLTFIGLRNQKINASHFFAYSIASFGMAFGIVMAIFYPLLNYMNFGMWIMWGMGSLLMIPLVIITLAKANELFRSSIGIAPSRLIPLDLKSKNIPKVSIHVPAYKEEPHVLSETLKSLSKLTYPNYEVLVIINNTPEDYYKSPIKELCEDLGEKFKYLDITCTGFKAGALNMALDYTDKDAEIIAVIDADYKVESSWLVDLVPLFDDPKVAIVQAPQDHRDGDESIIKSAMNAEYAGFFDIGMVDRNEENAIVVHGTMVMVRLSSMMEVGGWGTDTIVEDSELGLRLFEAGYIAHYTNRRYGFGLLPDSVEAFKTQRHRWAYGAIQILKKHWREFKPSSKKLSSAQKNKFVTGWFFWLSDAMGPVMAIMNIIWVPVIIFVGVTIPTIPLTIPIITAFLVNILHTFILYRTKVKATFKEIFLSSIASMSLQLIIFKAVFDGFIKDGLPFKRTEKGGKAKKGSSPIKYETIFAILLLSAFFSLIFTNSSGIFEIYLFASTILIQAIPYISAIILRALELYSIKNNK